MYNYLIYNEYKYPAVNSSYFCSNVNLSTNSTTIPGTQNSPISLVVNTATIDGGESNTRKVTFTLAIDAPDPQTYLVIGNIFNGSRVKEYVTINAMDTTAETVNMYYMLEGIYPPANSTIDNLSIGYSAEGYTSLTQSNGCKTDHFLTWETGTADVTVYGSMNPYLNQKTTALDLKEFPLSTTLTNFTTSMTAPEYYQLPVGFFRAKIDSGSTADIVYRVGMQTLMN